MTLTQHMLDAALSYARRGMPVLPLAVGGKTPITKHGKDDATTDLDQVRRYWRLNGPAFNVGIRPAPGYIVLDVDPRNGGELEALGGIPPTRIAATGGGGWHVWFRWNGPTRGMLADTNGIDIKTHSGYLVAPPSIHPSGNTYRWLSEEPAAPLPQHLVERVSPARPTPVKASIPRSQTRSQRRFDEVITRMADQPEGNRNHFLFWAACRLTEQGADPATFAALAAAAQNAGLDDRQIDKTIESARRAAA